MAATQLTEIDMAVGSLSLDPPPAVTVRCLRNQLVLRARDIEDFVFGRRLRDTLLGKVLRIPQGPAEDARSADLDVLLGRPVTFLQTSQHFTLGGEGRWPSLRPQPPARRVAPRPGRRRVLVLAQKVAVGGVERNTVEISRALARDHDCLYLTLERVHREQGSLTHQAVEASAGVLDLAEIAHHGIYPALLRLIDEVYAPDTLWICNGSMWLCAEAAQVREIFARTGIVDQQVYDTDEGWIRRYTEPGIQSFDRFIAINRKIRDRFVNDMGLDPDRVDLIYSAINADRFRAARAAGHDRDAQREAYGLPRDKTVLAFMGRLVDQKRPLDFLELARASRERDDLHFALVGNGMLAPAIETALADEKPGNLTWIRNVADTTTFWPAIDGYVVTSEYEGLPIALIEAIAMGVPALSTDVGDIPPRARNLRRRPSGRGRRAGGLRRGSRSVPRRPSRHAGPGLQSAAARSSTSSAPRRSRDNSPTASRAPRTGAGTGPPDARLRRHAKLQPCEILRGRRRKRACPDPRDDRARRRRRRLAGQFG